MHLLRLRDRCAGTAYPSAAMMYAVVVTIELQMWSQCLRIVAASYHLDMCETKMLKYFDYTTISSMIH